MSRSKELTWSDFKSFLSARACHGQYIEANNHYYLFTRDDWFEVECSIYKGAASDDLADFETNFKSTFNQKLLHSDADGVPTSRVKMAAEGAKFCFHGIEFATSTLSSVVETKADGTSFGYSSVKLYDVNGSEITAAENETNCVKTVLSFEPISKNYEIIGGVLNQGTVPTTPIRAWAIGAPTVPEQYGGSIHFLATARCDLASAGRAFNMDGRVPKYMRYDANYHSSRFDFVFKHNAGVKHSFQIMLELFWP